MTVPPDGESVPVDFITPRHLAGGGDPAWITVPLHRACGWSHGNDPLMPRVLLSSPDRTTHLQLEPQPDRQWWTLTHTTEPGRPAWHVSFASHTPVELVAAVTDTLTAPAPSPDAPSDPYEPLRQAGWTPRNDHILDAPDKTASINRLGIPGHPAAHFVIVRLEPHQTVWHAHFDKHTPQHLLGAFTAALVDPVPAARTYDAHSLPHDPRFITRRTTEVPAVLVAGALEGRVRALAARHTAPAPSSAPVQGSSSTNGRSR